MEDVVSKFSDAVTAACDKSFKKTRTPTKTQNGTLVARRLNSRKEAGKCIQKEIPKKKKTNNNTREQRKMEYQAEKAQYQVRIKNAKIQSWKQYYNKTQSTNPWNIVYKSAAGKVRSNQIMTPLQKADGSQTEGLRETLQCTLEYLIPKDDQSEETEYHKQIRNSIEEPIETEDDRNFKHKKLGK